jgi:hypothetical protein
VKQVDLEEIIPQSSSDDDLESQFSTLADAIEIAEWALRLGEFAPVGKQTASGRTYTFRVNGREYESPHVHITCPPEFSVRVFLGADPAGVTPDNEASPSFDQQIRNRKTRELLLTWVRSNHPRLIAAWVDAGNPIHGARLEHTVTANNPGRIVRKKLNELGATGLRTGSLNAHLNEQQADLNRTDPSFRN